MKLVFASNNAHKLDEVRHNLSDVEVVSLREVGFIDEIEETGVTLEENSHLKAQTIWDWLIAQQLEKNYDGVFADDTGLEIESLNGAPGVYSARWAGEPANDANNRAKALRALEGQTNRNAQFRTVITWIGPKVDIQVEGIVLGTMATTEQGDGGFGYDAIFIPQGYNDTFASLPTAVKNTISHRGRAMQALKNEIVKHQ